MTSIQEAVVHYLQRQKLATVAGATQSGENAKKLYAAIQQAAKKGDTQPITVQTK